MCALRVCIYSLVLKICKDYMVDSNQFHFPQNRNVIVFYGSQTGTAEEFATRLAKDASRYGMKGMVADPEECDMVF